MRISFNPNIAPNYTYNTVKNRPNNNINFSTVNETQKIPPIKISTVGNVTRISFKGNFIDPTAPSIQFKVRGVSNHQNDFGSTERDYRDRNVEKLANSNWQDGQRLCWEIKKNQDGVERIVLSDHRFGDLGRVPDEIAPSLIKLLKKNEQNFAFQLSNVIAGTTKGAPTIGLRANLIYTGDDDKLRKKSEEIFGKLLNSKSKDISDSIMLYQPKTTPKQILHKIFSNVQEAKGEDSAYKVLDIVDAISDELTAPENKNILLLGHINPDGDTIGCVLGLQAALKANYPTKNVVCSIDDDIPGIYRDKIPGIHNITKPSDPKATESLKAELAEWKAKPQSFVTRNKIRTIEKELSALEKSAEILGNGASIDGGVPSKYDLVVLMDIPAPTKFTSSYKNEIENAGKVIYIDHHRERFEEWNAERAKTGIDMQKVRENNLALVLPELPAATEIVTVVADNAGLLDKTMKNIEYAKQFVAAIVSGTSSDTGGFSRTANYSPEDMFKPVQDRPNYFPEGLSKWLIDKFSNVVDKKWLRENIVYDLPDKKVSGMSQTAREKMINYCKESQSIYAQNGFGVLAINYEQMYDIWEQSKLLDKKVTFGDVQNSIKYSEVMNGLRETPDVNNKDSGVEPYSSPYQDDKISLLLIQDKKAGQIDAAGNIADENSIRMSFRSQEGTYYAEQLASLFGGGGHGSASGARITIKDVELTSPLAIKIDGEVEYSPDKIYKALQENYDIKNNPKMSDNIDQLHKFETIIDEKGLPVNDLINSIVSVIRDTSKQAKLSNIKKS